MSQRIEEAQHAHLLDTVHGRRLQLSERTSNARHVRHCRRTACKRAEQVHKDELHKRERDGVRKRRRQLAAVGESHARRGQQGLRQQQVSQWLVQSTAFLAALTFEVLLLSALARYQAMQAAQNVATDAEGSAAPSRDRRGEACAVDAPARLRAAAASAAARSFDEVGSMMPASRAQAEAASRPRKRARGELAITAPASGRGRGAVGLTKAQQTRISGERLASRRGGAKDEQGGRGAMEAGSEKEEPYARRGARPAGEGRVNTGRVRVWVPAARAPCRRSLRRARLPAMNNTCTEGLCNVRPTPAGRRHANR